MIILNHTSNGVIRYEYDKIQEHNKLQKSLKYLFPDRMYSEKFNTGKWDGYIRFYDKYNRTFPRGFESIATKYLEKNGIEYKINYVEQFESGIEFDSEVRPYQIAALKQFFIHRHGIIKVPTRGGKTYIAAEGIRHVRSEFEDAKVLFFVDTSDLFEQAINDISKHNSISKTSIGQIKGDKFDLKNITICTIQTITNILFFKKDKCTREQLRTKQAKRKSLLQYLAAIDFYIVDECHEYSSEVRLNIIRKMKNAEFRMFISATPFKSQSELNNLNLRTVSGEILYEITENDLKEQGYLAMDALVMFTIDHESDGNIDLDENDDYRLHLKRIITHNKNRNYILINTIEICRKFGLKTLVLFSRKEHGYFIKSITDDPFISGDMLMKERNFLKNSFLRKKGGVLFASDVFKKGITLPEAQVMINASGGLEKSLITQKKGRVLGVKGKKTKAMYIDFMDLYKYFTEHSASRLEAYEESLPDERMFVLDTEDNDFYTDLKGVIQNWFEL